MFSALALAADAPNPPKIPLRPLDANDAARVTHADEPARLAESLSPEDLQALVPLLRQHYAHPEMTDEAAVARATAQGLFARLGRGLSVSDPAAVQPAGPFRSEWINGDVLYARMAAFTPENLAAFDAALEETTTKKTRALVLDLRQMPAALDYESAATVCRRLCPKGRILFALRRPDPNAERILTSREDPRFDGRIVVLVDRSAASAAEVVAATLRTHTAALIVGERTRGEAAEFQELDLPSGKKLRVAIGRVEVAEKEAIFPGGVKPDVAVEVLPEKLREILAAGEKGVAALVAEPKRVVLNEAALVAGRNAEVDALLERQKNAGAPPPLRDPMLQRALDHIEAADFFLKQP